MKPRIFIGSSKESTKIAYAAQQNLQQVAEVTVWDQGVFQLSITSLESLLEILKTSDFGMFVFSKDDVVTMRGKQSSAVRDNVIFELGLFVGLLGRERCFILIPDNHQDLHIPTDLIGMNPALYESERSDESFQAATGPACHSIGNKISQLKIREGRISPTKVGGSAGEKSEEQSIEIVSNEMKEGAIEGPISEDWIELFFAEKYSESIAVLQKELEGSASEQETVRLKSRIEWINFKTDATAARSALEALIKEYPSRTQPYLMLSSALEMLDLQADAIDVLDRGIASVTNAISLLQSKARLLSSVARSDEAIQLLQEAINNNPDQVALRIDLADSYIDHDKDPEAKHALEDALEKFPKNEILLDRYARVLYRGGDKKLSLVPYNQLLSTDQKNTNNLAMRANTYLDLGLNNCAFRDYKLANELTDSKEAWILANLGNILSNQGFFTEAVHFFRKALVIEPSDEYAIERLGFALKKQEAEDKKLRELEKEARGILMSERLKKSKGQ